MPKQSISGLKSMIRDFIEPYQQLIYIKQEKLTSEDENYSSILYKLDIILHNHENSEDETIYAVAKVMNTEVNEYFRKLGPLHFRKEIAFYTEVIPTLQEFQKEQGMADVLNFFPKLYAARKNLNGGDEVDDDAVIILENLKMRGYSNIDRLEGFDLDGAKLILRDMAHLHAVPLALKLKKPQIFEEKIKKNCLLPQFITNEDMKQQCSVQKLPEWCKYIGQDTRTKVYYKSISEMARKITSENFFARPPADPFSTFVHFDLWVNNTMQTQNKGRCQENKFLDFQIYRYGSVISDIIFFLFSSCQREVYKYHYDELMKYYHTELLQVLHNLDCDTTPFDYHTFLDNIEIHAPPELIHILLLAVIIKGKKGVPNIDVKKEEIEVEGSLTYEAKEAITDCVCEFAKRGWIGNS